MKHEGFIDNRKVKDDHQGGIERVKLRKGDLQKGQGGKMGKVDKAHWNRQGGSLTPRKG